MKHPSARSLFEYWDRLRAARAAPERAEIEPAQIGRLLGDLLMLESEGDNRYLIRLAGTRLCALLGQELRNRAFHHLFAASDRAILFGMLAGVAEEATPAVAGVAGETANGRAIDLELLMLPLKHRGRVNTRMLGALLPLEVPYWTGTEPLALLRIRSLRMMRDEEPGTLAGLRRGIMGRLRLVQGGRS